MHNNTHTHPPRRHLTALTHFKSSFPGSANHITLCARNPHRPGNCEVTRVEQAASVVVLKLLLWSGRETLSQREREREIWSSLNQIFVFVIIIPQVWKHSASCWAETLAPAWPDPTHSVDQQLTTKCFIPHFLKVKILLWACCYITLSASNE